MTEKLQLPLTSASAVNLLSFSPPSPAGFSQIQNVQRGALNTFEKDLTPDSRCHYVSTQKCVCKKAGDPKAAGSGDSLGVPTGPLLPALGHSALPGSLVPAPVAGDYSPGWPTELGHRHIAVVLVSTCKWLLMDSPAPFFFTKSSFLKTTQITAESSPQGKCLSGQGGGLWPEEQTLAPLPWLDGSGAGRGLLGCSLKQMLVGSDRAASSLASSVACLPSRTTQPGFPPAHK